MKNHQWVKVKEDKVTEYVIITYTYAKQKIGYRSRKSKTKERHHVHAPIHDECGSQTLPGVVEINIRNFEDQVTIHSCLELTAKNNVTEIVYDTKVLLDVYKWNRTRIHYRVRSY